MPSRLTAGSWYALPQSPQLFKQLFMMAGFERYYQIARCFRDEDLRADRQPEFTQLDLEMGFVAEADVIDVMEAVMGAVFEATGFDVPPRPWPKMCYDEAVGRFGIDRPDTRFGLDIHDVSELVRGSEFKVFEGVLSGGGVVRAINAGAREMSRSELEGLNEVVSVHGAKAVAPIYAGDGGWTGNLAKFFSAEQIAAVNAELGRLRRRPAAVRRRQARGRRGVARRPAARAGSPLRADPRRPPRRPLGRRLPDVRA